MRSRNVFVSQANCKAKFKPNEGKQMKNAIKVIDAKIKELLNAQDEMITDDVTLAVLQNRHQLDSFDFDAFEKLRADVDTLSKAKRLLTGEFEQDQIPARLFLKNFN